jgi:hypothetical protein
MEQLDVKDVEQPRTARTGVLNAAAILFRTQPDPVDQAGFDNVLDHAVRLYKAVSSRIKIKAPAQAA